MFEEENSIKNEEDPFNAFNHDCAFFNHCITNFYDHDSPQQHQQCTPHEVICYLEHVIDICNTPLADILQTVTQNPAFRGVDMGLLKRKLLKQKNKLKRERAKNRKNLPQKRMAPFVPIHDQQEQQYKKKRNRISAQMSRDRKKEKVRALEELNRQLQQECQLQKEENQRLKRQAKQKNNKSNDIIKGPFARMLIFLGIFFLFTVVRDIFDSADSTKAIAKIHKTTANILQSKEFPLEPSQTRTSAFQEIEKTLTETVEDKGIASKLKEGLQKKMVDWWEKFGSKQQQGQNPMAQLSFD